MSTLTVLVPWQPSKYSRNAMDDFEEHRLAKRTMSMRETIYQERLAKLVSLLKLANGWDSYDAPAPNITAARQALRILKLSEVESLVHSKIVASAEGGIAICFSRGDRYADLECFNDGTTLGARFVGNEPATLIETDGTDASIRSALDEIRNHFGG